MLETVRAFFLILTHHLPWKYVWRSVFWEDLCAGSLKPNSDQAVKGSQSTRFTTFRLRRPAPQVPSSPHSQALTSPGILWISVLIWKHMMLPFLLECFYLFLPWIEAMTYFWRKADNNEKITIRSTETVIVTTDWWIPSMRSCTKWTWFSRSSKCGNPF